MILKVLSGHPTHPGNFPAGSLFIHARQPGAIYLKLGIDQYAFITASGDECAPAARGELFPTSDYVRVKMVKLEVATLP